MVQTGPRVTDARWHSAYRETDTATSIPAYWSNSETREVFGIYSKPTESALGWSKMLNDLYVRWRIVYCSCECWLWCRSLEIWCLWSEACNLENRGRYLDSAFVLSQLSCISPCNCCSDMLRRCTVDRFRFSDYMLHSLHAPIPELWD